MTEGIIIAIITGGLAIASNVIIAATQNNKTLYRIEQLEIKVDKHNNLIERMYKVEEQIEVQREKIKTANHRIDDLEQKTK